MKWNEMNGMEWNGMERNGMEWNGMSKPVTGVHEMLWRESHCSVQPLPKNSEMQNIGTEQTL